MATDEQNVEITPDILLRAYACGIFPMAEDADDPNLHWIEPRLRAIMPLESFHVPRRLARTIRAEPYEIRVDVDFDRVIAACAGARTGGERTWINARIRALYRRLFDIGHCHTVEAYQGGELVGGLYGVSLGAAFFGESMFHTARDASKIALVHLAGRLKHGGFRLLDAQFQTSHLAQFGTLEIKRRAYRALLEEVVVQPADFYIWPKDRVVPGSEVLAALGGA